MQFEPKWDGVRAGLTVEDGRARIFSRNGADLTPRSVGVRGTVLTFGLVRVQFLVRDKCRSLVIGYLSSCCLEINASCVVGATPNAAAFRLGQDTLTSVDPRTEHCISESFVFRGRQAGATRP
ncbi:hypothetical protein [Sinomonas terricola]|uniref:hypothetical protein n=1 Tax=Sinomonas terricola TaxID=3110330 RepID=UPI002B203AE5|nr:hypothetical protein [Sinomonas sp. JGH33]